MPDLDPRRLINVSVAVKHGGGPDLALDGCRYIEYMCDMMAEEPIVPHSKPIMVRSIAMTPLPLFNKQRSGCRPFCEVYVGDERVLTTSQEYDKMR